MIEADERGWYQSEGYVCPDCVEDDFLKEVIRENACCRECDYCGRRTRKYSAAPVASLMEPIADAVFYYFNDPVHAGVPYDDGLVFEPTHDTQDVLLSLSLDCHEKLFEDIAKAFVNEQWIETAYGYWASSHPHEEMRYLWNRFVHTVKHEIRYFFDHSQTTSTDQVDQSANVLPTIGNLVKEQRQLSLLPVGTHLFRARQEKYNFTLDADHPVCWVFCRLVLT